MEALKAVHISSSALPFAIPPPSGAMPASTPPTDLEQVLESEIKQVFKFMSGGTSLMTCMCREWHFRELSYFIGWVLKSHEAF
jgi:hypothetical protein